MATQSVNGSAGAVFDARMRKALSPSGAMKNRGNAIRWLRSAGHRLPSDGASGAFGNDFVSRNCGPSLRTAFASGYPSWLNTRSGSPGARNEW